LSPQSADRSLVGHDSSTKSSRVCLTDTNDLSYTIHENIPYEVHKEIAGLRERERGRGSILEE
jgi:hypothetical protein